MFKIAIIPALLFACVLLPFIGTAQLSDSQIKEYLRTTKFDIDTGAKAVVLYESVHVDILMDAGIAKETRKHTG